MRALAEGSAGPPYLAGYAAVRENQSYNGSVRVVNRGELPIVDPPQQDERRDGADERHEQIRFAHT